MPRRRSPWDRAVLAPRIAPSFPMCEPCGRTAYPSEQAAAREGAVMRNGRKACVVLQCPVGNGFHVTRGGG